MKGGNVLKGCVIVNQGIQGLVASRKSVLWLVVGMECVWRDSVNVMKGTRE